MSQIPAHRTKYFFLLFALLFIGASLAHASSDTISSTNKYAWGNLAGWTNFAPSDGSVMVSTSTLTGYAWSTDDGWINLSPSNGGVKNDGQGNLSGFAWDELNGWINFQGVTIDQNGLFHGEAMGITTTGSQNIINFDCANCKVISTWHAPTTATAPPVPNSGFSGQGGIQVTPTQDNSSTYPPITVTSAFPTPPIEPPAGETVPGLYPQIEESTSSTSGNTAISNKSGLGSAEPSLVFPDKITTSSAHATTKTTPLSVPALSTKMEIMFGAGSIFILSVLIAMWLLFSKVTTYYNRDRE